MTFHLFYFTFTNFPNNKLKHSSPLLSLFLPSRGQPGRWWRLQIGRLGGGGRDFVRVSDLKSKKSGRTRPRPHRSILRSRVFTLGKEYNLAGIDVVNEELNLVRKVGDRLRNEAMKFLERGMKGLNQAEVGTELQHHPS